MFFHFTLQSYEKMSAEQKDSILFLFWKGVTPSFSDGGYAFLTLMNTQR